MDLRYKRQVLLEDFGVHGQKKISEKKVLMVGLGGLGSPYSLYLNSMGVGSLTLMDDDLVAESNLHRQVLFSPKDIGQPKVACAKSWARD